MRSSLWSFLACKIHEFWRWKLWDQNFVPFDLEHIHIKESKKPGYTFSFELRTKFVWSHDLIILFFHKKNSAFLNYLYFFQKTWKSGPVASCVTIIIKKIPNSNPNVHANRFWELTLREISMAFTVQMSWLKLFEFCHPSLTQGWS